MSELNGGLTAPAPERGLGVARRPRSVNRRQTPRGKKIQRAVAEQQQARAARDGGSPAVDGRNVGVDPGYGHTPQRSQPAAAPAVGDSVQADLGAQLSHRVSAGAIDQVQADQVSHDRALLERAYGPNWRVKVFGNAHGAKGLGWGTSGARTQTIRNLRSSALDHAKAKLAG